VLKINGLYPCCLHISSFERQIHYTLSFNPIYDKSICLTKLLWRKMHHGPIKLWNGTCNTLHRTYKWHHFKILFPARMQLNYISLFIGMKTQHTNSCWAGANFSIFQAKIWNHVLYYCHLPNNTNFLELLFPTSTTMIKMHACNKNLQL
jgi:hypothetical protein